ncbi:MAG TPA: phosphoribosylformylglycinamidine synthase subunit PurQ [Candidatus Saccharicenans sp.]|nr:phosphoribosylformylglycinamidine synthase subunit PurQ [Candidatus Saccharicenans sp.]HRD02270.1 phosphoribosylformylglycinamidine synthase subunit PurQ [Candidatus Saccharicenans sp.]
MKFGVVVFPGSNCDFDTFHVLQNVMRQETVFLWHKDSDLQNVDCVILPGGFSCGDYLRSGAFARFSPIMAEVQKFAAAGGLVLGICNGFQILLEAGLLPGAMLRNKNLKFICQHVYIKIDNNKTPFSQAGKKNQVLSIPIAHFDGNYYAPPEMLAELERKKQIVFRYCDENGQLTEEANVNGSLHHIAGVVNEQGNVLGMMPHPERASEKILGSADGQVIFQSIIDYLEKKTDSRKKKAGRITRPVVSPLPPHIGNL